MFLLVNPNGSKYFRLKYRIDGKEKTLALGVYPQTTLKQAREKRDAARKQIADGIDPSANKKAVKVAVRATTTNALEVVGLEWFERNAADKSDRHKERILRLFNKDLFPYLGSRAIAEIKAVELLEVIRKIEERGAVETAHRSLQICGQVWRYAIATGRAERNIVDDLRGSLQRVVGGHFSALTKPSQLAGLLRAIDGYTGSPVVKAALQIAPMVFVRPGELRAMEWSHIDFESKEWRYFVSKTQVSHIVPLASQALKILDDIKPLTGGGRYVFPSARTPNGRRCISDMALLAALRRMGFTKDEMTIHGFRAVARTLLDEILGFRPDFIEHQLAHAVKDPNGRAYNRTAHLEARREMMQVWSDYLDKLKLGENKT